MEKILSYAHKLLENKITKESICVDMTIGNGHDTLFLCKHSKFVYGFDIQDVAINQTRLLLENNQINNFQLINDNFCNINNYINNKVDAFIYNLGYLPNGNKNITTLAKDTLKSLKKSLKLLNNNGIIVIVIYTGHSEGKIENQKLQHFAKKLDQKEYDVITYKFINQINNPPYVLAIERRK